MSLGLGKVDTDLAPGLQGQGAQPMGGISEYAGGAFSPSCWPHWKGAHSERLITSVSRKAGLKGFCPPLQVHVGSAGTFVFCSGAAAGS